MKGRTVFGFIGWFLIGLTAVGFLLRALFHVKTGTDFGYLNYKFQPMTYLGALATFGVLAIVGLIGLGYRVKRSLQERSRSRMRDAK